MKIKLIFILLIISTGLYAQNISFTLDNGYMINADRGFLRMGLGTTTSVIFPSNIPLAAGLNYYTFSASLINYPHTRVSYSPVHFNNGIDDAFHYAKLQVGYRFGIRFAESNGSYRSYIHYKRYEGLSFEPKIGTAIYNISFDNTTVITSAYLHYIKNNI